VHARNPVNTGLVHPVYPKIKKPTTVAGFAVLLVMVLQAVMLCVYLYAFLYKGTQGERVHKPRGYWLLSVHPIAGMGAHPA